MTSDKKNTMPGLTVDTGSSPNSRSLSPTSHPHPEPSSPVSPSYSPITPTREATFPESHISPEQSTPSRPSKHLKSFSHPSQTPQTFIPHPPPRPETIDVTLDDNPDAMALRSAISLLQMQKRNAKEDMKILSGLKRRALEDPVEFVNALERGEIKSRPIPGMGSIGDIHDSEEDSDEEMQESAGPTSDTQARPWPEIPTSQKIIKMPPINWEQYGVVGESLDKIHADQVENPAESQPVVIGPDGNIVLPEDPAMQQSLSNASAAVAAAAPASKPPMDKMATRKGGKR